MTGRAKRGHRIFAATYDLLDRAAESAVLGPVRAALVGAASGRVLEIGAGTGRNFPYYRRQTELVAIEPDPFMLERAQRRARELKLRIDFHECPAEALPFPDASFDTVVGTLVLCSVTDEARALQELHRVLRPGGTYAFIEHVRGPGLMGRLHDRITPLWGFFAGGCHPNRRTVAAIEAAGFTIARLEQRRLLLFPLVSGVALPRGE